jgi:hypothetical protein
MDENLVNSITSKIFEVQDENGCWNVLKEGDKYYAQYNYYVPNFKSTLWTLIFLADMGCDINKNNLKRPLKIISDQFLHKELNIYHLEKSHFPIPCLNGNMLYLHSYFQDDNDLFVSSIVDFFAEYQRFDDGDFKTPSSFPYCSNRSCYGKHTCYWGVVKLLKGLSFIRQDKRTKNAQKLIGNCIDYILLHKVCYSSHKNSEFLHSNIKKLTFPNMYQSDYLEILWLLKREKVKSAQMGKALDFLESRMELDSTWEVERQLKNLVIPFGKKYVNQFITKRAGEVIAYYRHIK